MINADRDAIHERERFRVFGEHPDQRDQRNAFKLTWSGSERVESC
jgi:hypothetical protein